MGGEITSFLLGVCLPPPVMCHSTASYADQELYYGLYRA